jgi:PAS domain S-box-containing protein
LEGPSLISHSPQELRLARLWPWIESTPARSYGFAVILGLAATGLHWLLLPLTQGRISFIFFVPAIVLATTLTGRWPGTLVAAIGIVNAILMKTPSQVLVPWSPEQVSIIAALLVSILIIVAGDYFRAFSRRELSDLTDLHELSTALASIPRLQEQLQLILATVVRMHGAQKGLVSIYDPARDCVVAAASQGYDARALESLQMLKPGEGATGLAYQSQQRVIIEDADRDPRVTAFRELQRQENVRAVHATPLIGRDGAALGAITVHLPRVHKPTDRELRIADICARKAAVFIERARAEELANLRDRRFRAVLEASAVPFVVLSPVREAGREITDFRFTFLNTAAARVMGLESSEVVGRLVRDVLPRAWDDQDRFRMYVEALERREVREMERSTAADGDRAWYHVIASPLDGDLAVWFADITQRKIQERELIEADRRKDEFLATLAHELRNPLAPIRQAAAIARSDKATESQKRWSHDVIERQVQHMSLLLDDLLDVSRITHGTLQLRRKRVDLRSVLDAAVETARPLIDERRHSLELEVPDQLELDADPLRLAQVFSNLLTNAAKYTHPAGRIRVTAGTSEGELQVIVEDNGIGIAASDLPRVFGMFAQLRSAQDHAGGGLGIGLALAKGIVGLHGGRIEAASGGIGMGSRFTVHLPCPRERAQAEATSAVRADGGNGRGKRILLADDNRDAAESLAVILRLEGHEVELAHDGEAALAKFADLAPEVAVLDIGMPRHDGYEVARRIRQTPRGKHVRLIALTGWAQDADKARAQEAGFDLHLTKPVEPEALIGLLIDRQP